MSGCFDCGCDKKPNLLQRLVHIVKAKLAQRRAVRYLPSLIQRTKQLDQIVENQRVQIARLEKFLKENFEDFNVQLEAVQALTVGWIGTPGSNRPSNLYTKTDSSIVGITSSRSKSIKNKKKSRKNTKKKAKGEILWQTS